MKFRMYKIITNVLCIVCLVGFTAYLIATWKDIPDQIPAHFNAAGEVDRMGGKGSILMLPIMNWLLYGMISFIEMFPQIWNTGVKVTEQNKERVYNICRSMLILIKLIVVIDFTFMAACMAKGQALPIWFTPVFLGVLFGTIILHIVLLFRSK